MGGTKMTASTDHLTTSSTITLPSGQQKPLKVPQYVAALSATLGAFALGTVLGWTSPANPKLKDEEGYSDEELSWIGALMTLGAAVLAIPIGLLMDKFGRKLTMLALVIPFTLGWCLIAFADNVDMYYAGRFFAGLSGGAVSVVAPVYSGEIAEKEVRGQLGVYFQLMVTLGILFTYCIGPYVSVLWLSVICGIVPLIFCAIFFFMPESPRYYMMKDRRTDAVKSLKWLRGKHYDVEPELEEIRLAVEEAASKSVSIKEIINSKASVKAIIISFGLMIFQQLGGINAVIFYTGDIFNAAGSSLDASISTIIIGVVQVVATFISSMVIDRVGRRVLLLLSDSVMAICAMLLGVFFYYKENDSDTAESISWLPIVSMAIFIVAFSLGYGPIPWMMVGEIFPPEIKGKVGSVSCMLNWVLAFIVTKFFTNMTDAFGTPATFWIFAVISVIGTVFVFFVVIETKGKSLEEIQLQLSGESVKNLSGVDHDIERY